MRNTPRTSLQQKLTWVIMATTGATLLVASLFFVVNDVLTLRESKVRDLKTLAEILGTNSQAALSFADPNAATTTLSGVRAKAFVNAAALYNSKGALFASYQRARNPGPLPASPGPDGHWFRGSSLVLVAPVMMDQDRIGTVYLQESMGDITLRLQRYAGVALLIILGASLFALLVSSRLQRAVSEPILELAETATAVSREQNYALRAKRRTDDEIGVLIDSFNGMLGQIERNSAELQELNSQLADSEQKALAANQAKSAFLARMSHELRTPLNAIIGYSEMLQEEAEDLDQPDFLPDLRKINSAGKHLLALINDILDLSKVEAGKMDLYLEDFAVDGVVREVCATVEPLLQKNRNRLQVDCPDDIGTMHSDLTKVRQMLFNLLSNASKFTEDGEVGVQVRRESKPEGGDWIRFTVTDTGIGMSPDQVDKVFDAFVQGDASTTRKYGGTGLGLAITQRFAEMMGGQIKASSRVGQGTQFTIRVPAIVSTEETSEPEAPVPVAEAPARATVLSIDDDAGARDLLSRFLTKEGFRVVAVGSGREGLRMAKEMHPDVITLDVMMPGMDGWAVLSTLKADPDVADIPVVVITMMDSRNIGYALGASEYLTKPLTKERVVSVVRKLIKSSTVLVVDDDADIRALIARFLQAEACKVLEAENGQAALDLMRDEVPGLILLDLMMPEMDGFTFVEEIRRRPDWGGIPIIVITALDLSAEDRSRLNGGVYKILQKGAYTRDELLRTVGALVSGWVTPSPAPAAEAN